MPQSLIDHLERYLGKFLDGWKSDDKSEVNLFDVVRYRGAFEGVVAFSTLGLSKHVLSSRVSEKSVRCELVMMTRDNGEWIPRILDQIGSEIVRSGFAPLRGDVIGPRGRIAPEYQMTSLYASIPIYLPENFSSFELQTGEQVVFIWLIPIYSREADLVRHRGWEIFEDELEKQDPDLLDMRRDAIVRDI